MCIFSEPVEFVASTNIFARGMGDRQVLVYSMQYAATGDLAMVLPLPVVPGSAANAVRFINLERYPDFFASLRKGFPQRASRSQAGDLSATLSAEPLVVHDVGSFEASFVPTLADFDRLDERFRIEGEIWQALPAYHDFGFAVFKLKATINRTAEPPKPLEVHPMAIEFPRRNPALLYFPTIHIHDGQVHSQAEFDHVLYCQADDAIRDSLRDQAWVESDWPAARFIDVPRAQEIVAAEEPCYRVLLSGTLNNVDAQVGSGQRLPS